MDSDSRISEVKNILVVDYRIWFSLKKRLNLLIILRVISSQSATDKKVKVPFQESSMPLKCDSKLFGPLPVVGCLYFPRKTNKLNWTQLDIKATRQKS
ncbi:hypothetical protein NPIL_543731 [Nephila pilipes]|uniref:Uncharacterized protein n=1 Tax=Nephila pilipes TaxID=299642 RepID=A0A8X6U456_NEPPI|nr:hypothetical protein NPIL_543731 [Nephila pilipes]